jgi:hypothetical protein
METCVLIKCSCVEGWRIQVIVDHEDFGDETFDLNYDKAKIWQCIRKGYDFVMDFTHGIRQNPFLHRDEHAMNWRKSLKPSDDVQRITALQFLSMATLRRPTTKHNTSALQNRGRNVFFGCSLMNYLSRYCFDLDGVICEIEWWRTTPTQNK